MTETQRHHHHRSSSINSSNNTSSSSTDLFICFKKSTFSSSSSSMRLSSLSPARSACLTTSLSRRLRTSGSIKNGVLNSPIFGANGRKRSGSGYTDNNNNNNNNIEPSSPKVTCIGQVRVKTRKHVKKKMRARSRRKGETFRRSSSVHLPVTICESLRSFGSELNCFSSCTDNKDRVSNGERNSCFTSWFVAVEENGGKRREIELVVGGEDEDRRRSQRRRHVFEGLDLNQTEKKERGICSPPKNALLLMRCRSDPVKVAALANRVKERQMSLNEGLLGGDEDEERRKVELDLEDKKRIELCEKWISGDATSEREIEVVTITEPEVQLVSNLVKEEEIVEEEDLAVEEEDPAVEATFIKYIEEEIRNAIEEDEQLVIEMEESEEIVVVPSVTHNVERSEQGNREPDPSPEVIRKRSQQEEVKPTPYKVLPDCLLLMMCEPKLSMEVSKETWVCSTDFVRCVPSRPPGKKLPEPTGEQQHQSKKRIVTAADSNASSRRRSIDKRPALLQPPRSSCSYPAAPPIIIEPRKSVGEHKVTGGIKAFEPPMLPRCKSEPRKSASKLAPDACFWKNRKLEPHPPANVGVGTAAGVGF